ncbi:MAG: Crp/Fnr family transcriptional regulator [Xanthobacteraceae bacterium]|nr:Crp/Fnr family transcriptional regulator [Xanthobacteraceae bacterium]
MREYALRLGIDLGSSLSEDEAKLLASVGTERFIDSDIVILRQDDPADCIHYLLSGTVKTFQTHACGQETVLRIHLPGSIIGLSCLTSRGHWDASSITLKPSRLLRLSKTSFLKLLEEHSSLGIKLLRLVVDRLSDLHFRIGELQTQTVEQRLAYALLSLSRGDPNKSASQQRVGISLTHEELAQLINTRRQTVTSTLARFAESGFIARSSRSIDVISPAGLQQLFETDQDIALLAS